MRLFIGKNTAKRKIARLKNKARIRRKIKGTEERPRLTIYRSLSQTYAQIIDDVSGKTLASASSKNLKLEGSGSNKEAAKKVGEAIAKAALEKNIKNVVFDRSGYVYHGRVKALADGAREAGLQF